MDFLQSDQEERTDILRRLRGSSAVLLAEKVETHEVFERASREGFTLFQGYYFCHPQLMKHQDIPANAGAQLELLRDLQQKNRDLPPIHTNNPESCFSSLQLFCTSKTNWEQWFRISRIRYWRFFHA
ncbi:MAG: hypothetical protein M1568_03360 [Acidobacteria bacterium]|nr:hypothetical protein [Acidobacteriota bacterium]